MTGYATIITGCSLAAVICAATQFCIKRMVPPRQYGYFRDVLLTGAWLLMAVWFASPSARVVVGGALLAGMTGLNEGPSPFSVRWLAGYLVIGMLCTFLGPSIHFIRFADGEYVYLTPGVSFALTSLWFFIFPLIFHHLDNIPGLVGHVLAVTFALMLMACLLMQGLASEAFFMTFCGLVLLGAFWSRFGNTYRQAGRAMSSMWSILVAGTAILGNSKGIVFSSMFFLSLGLFALPLAELSLYWVSGLFTDKMRSPGSAERLYQRMINRGLEHPEAVHFMAGVCALLSVAAALLQSQSLYTAWVCWLLAGLCALAVVLPLLFRTRREKKGPVIRDKPVLWGVALDNVSMNYAISRARGLIFNPVDRGAQLVATVNAIGMNCAARDAEYRDILKHAAMVLADGTGLLWGMRFLGMPLQARVTGIDFAEQLCRAAAVEKWPVYFLGAKGDTARECANALASRYPGLIIAGTRDGYFDVNDISVPEAVAASGAKILLAAMGLPRQEKWVAAHRERLGPLLAVGVGGAFDVFSGRLSRAPAWVQRSGLEWLYRLSQEPGRWKKDLELVSFGLRVLATKFGLR